MWIAQHTKAVSDVQPPRAWLVKLDWFSFIKNSWSVVIYTFKVIVHFFRWELRWGEEFEYGFKLTKSAYGWAPVLKALTIQMGHIFKN